jgi:hypothetical protein
MLLAGALVAIGLVVVALGMSWIRGELKRHQTWVLLERLDEALDAYHATVGHWPGDDGVTETRPAEPPVSTEGQPPWVTTAGDSHGVGLDAVSDEVVAALAGVADSYHVLQQIPTALWAERDDASSDIEEPAMPALRDAWGRRLSCVTAASPLPHHRQLLAANGGKPIFISAGPDGRPGHDDPADAADNLFLQPEPR